MMTRRFPSSLLFLVAFFLSVFLFCIEDYVVAFEERIESSGRENHNEERLVEERRGMRNLLGQKDHSYKIHEKVPLYANKIGPFHNPSETYQHYDLPFCLPADNQIGYKSEDLGEVLEGDRMVGTPYDISFRVDRDNESLCKKTLNSKDLKKFRKAVKDDYYFQMYYDDLPIWGFIGKIEKILRHTHGNGPELRYYLFTHVHFDISYNGDKIIEINVSTDPLRTVDITDGDEVAVRRRTR